MRTPISLLCATLIWLLAAAAPSLGADPSTGVGSARLDSQAEADAAMFALERYFDGNNDLDDIARLYAAQVDYFDWGLRPRADVLADKRAYLARWPMRRFRPDLATLQVAPRGRGRFALQIESEFSVSGGERHVEGRALTELTLARSEGGFVITAEGGRVLSRRTDQR